MKLNDRELATVLAALRHWQDDIPEGDREGFDHFDEKLTPLNDDEIDKLCEALNSDDDNVVVAHVDTSGLSGGAETGDLLGAYRDEAQALAAVMNAMKQHHFDGADDNECVTILKVKVGGAL